MNRIALALALARGEVSPEQGAVIIAKSRPAEPPSDDDLVKAGGAKPPAGFTAIPGSAHGGFRKPKGKGFTYWYPSEDNAKQAIDHHQAEARKNRRDPRDWGYSSASNTNAGRMMDSAFQEHSAHVEAARGYLDQQRVKEHASKERAAKKQREASFAELDAARANGAGAAPEGKHHIANREGRAERDTIASHGLYHVGGEPVKSGTKTRGNASHSYTVTHGPTGLVAAHEPTKAGAIAAAKHFHEHAGDAGHDAQFGKPPSKEAMARLGAAHTAWSEKKARKSYDDWSPDQSALFGSEPLAKGFTDLAAPGRLGAPEDAFHRVRPAQQLVKGGGDAQLKGIGAGFDARWNGGVGFGTRE